MVQTRWGHLNREHSLLTGIQALMLDGHHMVENRARFGAGCYFNFSGTGGIWRRKAIFEAGGWQHTLTEDPDLSYRAQLAGWRFIYRPDVLTPPSSRGHERLPRPAIPLGPGAPCRRGASSSAVWQAPLTLSQKVEASSTSRPTSPIR
jgi:hypothetical protein